MSDYREGQTATHKDGRKIVFRAGEWVNAQSPARSDDTADRIAMRAAGLPVIAAMHDPITRIQDPKRRDITRGSLLAAGTKEIAKAQPGVDAARNAMAALGEFDELNRSIRPTGDVLNRAYNWTAAKMGNSDLSRMEQVSSSMARLMRQPGEGAVSDYEGRMFRSMVGGHDKPFAANVRYSKAAKALAQRQIDQHQFRESYLQANGTLNGVDTMWNRYRDFNPLLDRKGNLRTGVPSPSAYFADRMQRVQKFGVDPVTKQIRRAPPSTRKPSAGWTVREAK